MKRQTIHRLLDSEHAYQLAKHGVHAICAPESTLSPADMLAVLVEEVGEVANALNERHLGNPGATDEHLAHELVQVMAVAGGWLLHLPDPSGEEEPS